MTVPLFPGTTIERRYRIVQLLGEGGFGRAYLTEDLNRFGELCMMKEFAPQVQGADALAKARELFQREAGVLYQLKHPQIPEFRELLQVSWQGQDSLFLVQQYIEGVTYWERLRQGHIFDETTVRQLLLDILPVLTYIHSRGVIHRDIAPDNLIAQMGTGKPVLIDFGGVKQVAISAIHRLAHSSPSMQAIPTQLFKQGYTPPEQIRGYAQPASDLYALAVTLLVLLTGKNPGDLYDGQRGEWLWQLVPISADFRAVLARMLADRIEARYATASDVEQALQQARPLPAKTVARSRLSNHFTALKTLVVAPRHQPTQVTRTTRSASPRYPTDDQEVSGWHHVGAGLMMLVKAVWWTGRSAVLLVFWFVKSIYLLLAFVVNSAEFIYRAITLVLSLAVIGGIITLFMMGRSTFSNWQMPTLPDWVKVLWPQGNQPNQSHQSNQSGSCQAQITTRYKELNVPASSLYSQVDAQLHARYPELGGRSLTNRPEDDRFREAWCQIAQGMLDDIERDRRSPSP